MKALLKNNTFRLILLLTVTSVVGLFRKQYLGIVYIGFVCGFSIAVIIRNRKNVRVCDIAAGIFFSLMCVPVMINEYPSENTIYIFKMFIDIRYSEFVLPTGLAYIACMSFFRGKKNRIDLIGNKKHVFIKTALCIVLVGGITGMLDIGLRKIFNMPVNFRLNYPAFAIGLETGFCEETIYRMFLFMLCVLAIRDADMTKTQSILCYAVMVIPHTFMHYTPQMIVAYPLDVLFMAVVRLLPMAIAQRRLNLASAVGIHALHNIIIYSFV